MTKTYECDDCEAKFSVACVKDCDPEDIHCCPFCGNDLEDDSEDESEGDDE